MVGGDASNDVAGFEHIHPGRRRGLADATVACQRIQVQQLTRARGGEAQKALECAEVVHCRQAANIALEITLDIVRVVPGDGFGTVDEPAFVHRRICAGMQQGVEGRRRNPGIGQFFQAHRVKFDQRGAPGEALRDACQQRELL